MTRIYRIIALWLLVSPLAGNAIEWYSSTATQCWKHEKSPKWATTASTTGVIEISQQRAQVIDGLGGTFNELGWDALCQLDEQQRHQVLYQLFSPQESNYTYCRMPIGASDFAMNFYSLNDVADDFEMINFSVARDRHILMRYIKSAQAIQPALKMWASVVTTTTRKIITGYRVRRNWNCPPPDSRCSKDTCRPTHFILPNLSRPMTTTVFTSMPSASKTSLALHRSMPVAPGDPRTWPIL